MSFISHLYASTLVKLKPSESKQNKICVESACTLKLPFPNYPVGGNDLTTTAWL